MYSLVSHNGFKYCSDSIRTEYVCGIAFEERDYRQVSDISISRVNVAKKSRKSSEVTSFLPFTFIDLQNIADSIEKGIFPVISNDFKPLRKEKYSFPKGFFVLNEIQKISRFYETIYGNTEIYSPETLCVKSLFLVRE